MPPETFRPNITYSCKNQTGITKDVSALFAGRGADIRYIDQFIDGDEANGAVDENELLHGRIVWREPTDRDFRPERFQEDFDEIAQRYGMNVSYRLEPTAQRVGILTSKSSHCLMHLLGCRMDGAMKMDIPFILSNHEKHKKIADALGIPFEHLPMDSTWSPNASDEENEASRVKEHDDAYIQFINDQNVDVLAFARYMKVFTSRMLDEIQVREMLTNEAFDTRRKAINLHHGPLPGAKYGDPSRQLYERGSKKVEATCHYLTANVDEGPILAESGRSIDDHDKVRQMRFLNRPHESSALAEGVMLHIQNRIVITRDGIRTKRFKE